MAGTLALVSASPYALKYLYTSGGAGSQVADVPKTTMATDAATAGPGPSPLAALLASTIADAAWDLLPEGATVSVYATPMVQTNAASQITAAFGHPSGPQLLRVTGLGQALNDTALIEIRFNHTINR